MDVFTHGLIGAQAVHAAGLASRRLSARERLLLGAAAAAFPDADFVGFLLDPLRFLAHWHQGPTHSLVVLPVWAWLLGGLFCAMTRRWQALGDAALVCAVGLASHIALDVITVYGTRVLYPLSDQPVSLGTTFVVDPIFTAIVGLSLLASLRTGRRRLAVAGLLLVAAYVGFQWVLKQRALQLAAEAARAAAVVPRRLDAIPQPFSPFNWTLIAVQGPASDVAHVARVNLAGHRALVPRWPGLERLHTMAHAYVPPDRISWERRPHFGDEPRTRELAQQLWERPDFAAFRHFAVHPAFSSASASEAPLCLWFTDLRYDLPALPDTFRYGYCRERKGEPWRRFRLRYFSEDSEDARQPLD